MSKNKNQSPVKSPVTAASIAALRESLAAQMAALETQEQEIKQKTFAALGEYIDSIPAQISKITGQADVKLADVLSFIKQREKGTLGSLVSTRQTGDTSARLSDEQRKNLSADMLARAVARKQGKPAVQISELMAKYNCSAATVNGYAPTDEELNAAMAAPSAVTA